MIENFVDIMRREFESRKARNRRYSLRAFARDLGLSVSALSQVMNLKKGLSAAQARKVADRLDLKAEEKEFFCCSVECKHARNKARREKAARRLAAMEPPGCVIPEAKFKKIATWYHFAICELTKLAIFQNRPEWISQRLGISLQLAKAAMAELIQTGMIREQGGELRAVRNFVIVPSDKPLESGKHFQVKMMEKAAAALFELPMDLREYSSTIFRVRRQDIPRAKESLREFRRNFMGDLEKGEGHDSVYCLGLQFFSLSKC